ncbi:MauE/DoxX family redox-associated membrane protein [Micromonospora sp. NPDC047707]|uniref:MauE/DoxX family redox-associated membrane protein n=1 Tax=unclassified Micromonospora TaxID=2617518 RepID=UPI0012B47859|nr:MauE/DoxX family redox-associated membrane protein [Micromonospora sp. WMMC415]QGN46298.1 hypothetical protein GKC29_05220 [Micromonospora sp. WMMC415]
MWLRLILGVVYVGMAVGQLASWTHMPEILAAYQAGGPAAMRALAVVLVAGELTCGLWFLTRPRSRALTPVWIYTGVSVLWATLGAQAFARGIEVTNCGCFGRHLSQRLSWLVLAQDALLLAYAAWMIRSARRRPVPPGPVPAEADATHHTAASQERT